MRKSFSLLRLHRNNPSNCGRGTSSLKLERKEKSVEHRILRQIWPPAAIALGVQHRSWRSASMARTQ